MALWGTLEFGQRFSAAIFSILSVALGYKAGRIILNRHVGLLAALLLALNPLHVWLAQEARMYSLLGALTIISMTVFWQALHTNRRRDWIALTAVNSIIYVLHYFGFLVPTIHFVFLVFQFRQKRLLEARRVYLFLYIVGQQ